MAPQVIRVILGVVVVVAVGTTLTQQMRLHDVPRESDAPAQESPVEFVSSNGYVCMHVRGRASAPRTRVYDLAHKCFDGCTGAHVHALLFVSMSD